MRVENRDLHREEQSSSGLNGALCRFCQSHVRIGIMKKVFVSGLQNVHLSVATAQTACFVECESQTLRVEATDLRASGEPRWRASLSSFQGACFTEQL